MGSCAFWGADAPQWIGRQDRAVFVDRFGPALDQSRGPGGGGSGRRASVGGRNGHPTFKNVGGLCIPGNRAAVGARETGFGLETGRVGDGGAGGRRDFLWVRGASPDFHRAWVGDRVLASASRV